jgi:hypothetical protein
MTARMHLQDKFQNHKVVARLVTDGTVLTFQVTESFTLSEISMSTIRTNVLSTKVSKFT